MTTKRRGPTPWKAKAERAGAERMRAILASGKWPSGMGVTDSDRQIIQENIARLERLYPDDPPRWEGSTDV